MSEAEQKARELIANQTLPELLDEWELTTTNNDPMIPTVRGWLMDELESRNPEAFNEWLDEDALDEELKWYMTKEKEKDCENCKHFYECDNMGTYETCLPDMEHYEEK